MQVIHFVSKFSNDFSMFEKAALDEATSISCKRQPQIHCRSIHVEIMETQ